MLALLMTLATLVPGATAVPGSTGPTDPHRPAISALLSPVAVSVDSLIRGNGARVPTAAAATAAPASAAPASAAPASAAPASAARAAAARRTIALTFDDGPHPRYTAQVLDVLRRYHVKATFCIVGDNAARYPALVRRIRAEGHRLCNHTRNHANMSRLSSAAARKQIMTAQRQIRAAAGISPTVFRFPYGASNARVRAVVRDCGLRNLGWTVDTRDWERPAAHTITARVLRGARPGAVVLMHDGGGNRSHTVASLDSTIRQLKRKGYTFVLG
ncbi:polysaccharide deacetylase family protein [Krasilnikovia sp. MM14-A1004]|uniref:polysaccharide deacetylase family protein n=1 Tax=Krasilnikovia sp. MM14-A1004 TaxID=3373541 RepID=UPI00399CD79A